MEDAPAESLGLAEQKGRMNRDAFVQYFKHFVKHTRLTEKSVLLEHELGGSTLPP
jgi:hypothetical protein